MVSISKNRYIRSRSIDSSEPILGSMKNTLTESFLARFFHPSFSLFARKETSPREKPRTLFTFLSKERNNRERMEPIRAQTNSTNSSAYVEREGSVDGVENSSRIDATWRGIAI